MDIKFLLNNIHKEVSCSLCMTTYTNPKQLPCLHSFCLRCLNGIRRTSGRHDIITCPKCRRESRVPRNLKDLPTNFRINSLLDVLAIKEHVTTAVKCGNCEKRSSKSFYCFQCCAFWCKETCIGFHNGIKAYKKHRVLALTDFKYEDFENVVRRPEFCQKKHHEKDELKFLCKICKIPICDACALTNHEGHTKILLEQAGNERKFQLKSVIESLRENVQKQRNKIAEIDKTCSQIKEKAANVKENAQTFAEALICVIEEKKQEICNEAENQAAMSIQRLATEMNEIEDQTKMTETLIEQTEILLKQSSSAEIVKLDMSVDAIFQEAVLDNERERVICALEACRRFIFSVNKTLMDKMNTEGIGSFNTGFTSNTRAHHSKAEGKGTREAVVGLEAEFLLTTRNAEGEQCYDEGDYVTVEIRNQQGQDVATKVHDNKGGSYKISYFAKETGKLDLSVKVNEDHVYSSPFAVEVKPRQFTSVSSFGQRGSTVGMLSNPWGVTVNEHNEITVTDTDNNRIQVFSCDGTYLRSFGRKGDKQGEFNWPAGIAFDKNGHIVVVDSNNHRVQVFSEQGKFLNQFGGEGSLDHQLKDPYGLSIDSEGNYIVADSSNILIKIFSPSGQLLRKIGGKGVFTCPYHCVQHDKYLIVSDSHEHCIKIFDRDGKFLYKFGKEGEGEGKFNKPRCLSVNKAGHLMVCDSWNDRVQVFELSGKFVKLFGEEGSDIGEFNDPFSTAVLSDGRIVVTDRFNHRIQIFE